MKFPWFLWPVKFFTFCKCLKGFDCSYSILIGFTRLMKGKARKHRGGGRVFGRFTALPWPWRSLIFTLKIQFSIKFALVPFWLAVRWLTQRSLPQTLQLWLMANKSAPSSPAWFCAPSCSWPRLSEFGTSITLLAISCALCAILCQFRCCSSRRFCNSTLFGTFWLVRLVIMRFVGWCTCGARDVLTRYVYDWMAKLVDFSRVCVLNRLKDVNYVQAKFNRLE